VDAIRLGWPVSNAWLLPTLERGPILVDTGHPSTWRGLRAGLRRCGLRASDLRAVLLTHRHSDHAGNAWRFARRGIPVYAHRADADILAGRQAAIRLRVRPGITGGFAVVENRWPARRLQVRPIEDGDQLFGLTVRWVPGHTVGSIFLIHPGSGTVLSGDTLLNAVPPLTLKTRLCLPHAPFCDDHGCALRSLRAFASSGVVIRRLLPGHGPPAEGPLASALIGLLDHS